MPGVSAEEKGSDKPQAEVAGAICAPPAPAPTHSATVNANNVPQPRQPTSLQGLLRFAMDATKADDSTEQPHFQQLDEERKKFLEEALKSMTVDVMEVLQKQIKVLQDVEKVRGDDDDVSEFTTAIDTILDYVDNIDLANDFHKIGGFMVLRPCLMSPRAEIRAGGCNLLAELSQNNPYCQNIILDNEFLPLLIEILEKEENRDVILGTLYAVSALVRDSPTGFSQLLHYKGLDVFKRILEKRDDKCTTKITFLLSALCRSQTDLKSRLIFLDYLPLLVSLISQERQSSHEHLLSLLVALVEDNATAVSECRNPRHDLKAVLQKYLCDIRNKEECMEEEQYCKRLLFLLFGEM